MQPTVEKILDNNTIMHEKLAGNIWSARSQHRGRRTEEGSIGWGGVAPSRRTVTEFQGCHMWKTSDILHAKCDLRVMGLSED